MDTSSDFISRATDISISIEVEQRSGSREHKKYNNRPSTENQVGLRDLLKGLVHAGRYSAEDRVGVEKHHLVSRAFKHGISNDYSRGPREWVSYLISKKVLSFEPDRVLFYSLCHSE